MGIQKKSISNENQYSQSKPLVSIYPSINDNTAKSSFGTSNGTYVSDATNQLEKNKSLDNVLFSFGSSNLMSSDKLIHVSNQIYEIPEHDEFEIEHSPQSPQSQKRINKSQTANLVLDKEPIDLQLCLEETSKNLNIYHQNSCINSGENSCIDDDIKNFIVAGNDLFMQTSTSELAEKLIPETTDLKEINKANQENPKHPSKIITKSTVSDTLDLSKDEKNQLSQVPHENKLNPYYSKPIAKKEGALIKNQKHPTVNNNQTNKISSRPNSSSKSCTQLKISTVLSDIKAKSRDSKAQAKKNIIEKLLRNKTKAQTSAFRPEQEQEQPDELPELPQKSQNTNISTSCMLSNKKSQENKQKKLASFKPNDSDNLANKNFQGMMKQIYRQKENNHSKVFCKEKTRIKELNEDMAKTKKVVPETCGENLPKFGAKIVKNTGLADQNQAKRKSHKNETSNMKNIASSVVDQFKNCPIKIVESHTNYYKNTGFVERHNSLSKKKPMNPMNNLLSLSCNFPKDNHTKQLSHELKLIKKLTDERLDQQIPKSSRGYRSDLPNVVKQTLNGSKQNNPTKIIKKFNSNFKFFEDSYDKTPTKIIKKFHNSVKFSNDNNDNLKPDSKENSNKKEITKLFMLPNNNNHYPIGEKYEKPLLNNVLAKSCEDQNNKASLKNNTFQCITAKHRSNKSYKDLIILQNDSSLKKGQVSLNSSKYLNSGDNKCSGDDKNKPISIKDQIGKLLKGYKTNHGKPTLVFGAEQNLLANVNQNQEIVQNIKKIQPINKNKNIF